MFFYIQLYEGWIDDIREERVTLDRIKLCICGNPRVGKSLMRESLRKPYLQSLVGKDVEVTSEECRKAHVRHRNHIDVAVGQRYLQRVGLCRVSGELCHAPFLHFNGEYSVHRCYQPHEASRGAEGTTAVVAWLHQDAKPWASAFSPESNGAWYSANAR